VALSPEWKLLLACAKRQLKSEDIRLVRAGEPGRVWAFGSFSLLVLCQISRHGLLGQKATARVICPWRGKMPESPIRTSRAASSSSL
jgi:hypothetical protein